MSAPTNQSNSPITYQYLEGTTATDFHSKANSPKQQVTIMAPKTSLTTGNKFTAIQLNDLLKNNNVVISNGVKAEMLLSVVANPANSKAFIQRDETTYYNNEETQKAAEKQAFKAVFPNSSSSARSFYLESGEYQKKAAINEFCKNPKLIRRLLPAQKQFLAKSMCEVYKGKIPSNITKALNLPSDIMLEARTNYILENGSKSGFFSGQSPLKQLEKDLITASDRNFKDEPMTNAEKDAIALLCMNEKTGEIDKKKYDKLPAFLKPPPLTVADLEKTSVAKNKQANYQAAVEAEREANELTPEQKAQRAADEKAYKEAANNGFMFLAIHVVGGILGAIARVLV